MNLETVWISFCLRSEILEFWKRYGFHSVLGPKYSNLWNGMYMFCVSFYLTILEYWERCLTIYYTLRFYFPYLSLLAQPVTIFVYGLVTILVYGPARYLHYYFRCKV